MTDEPADQDEPADHAEERSRRSTFAKIGAVAAGAWVAPQVLSTQAASAQSAPPCACPVAYANAYTPDPVVVLLGDGVPFTQAHVPAVGITSVGTDFVLAAAGTYRVTYALQGALGIGQSTTWGLAINGSAVPYAGTYVNTDQLGTQSVLVATTAGDHLSIIFSGGIAPVGILGPGPGLTPPTPAASILIELVA